MEQPTPGITTPKFWDCECEEHYIHRKTTRECPKCGAFSSSQPDSRVNEVAALLGPEYEAAPEILEALELVFQDWVTLVDVDIDTNIDLINIYQKAKAATFKATH